MPKGLKVMSCTGVILYDSTLTAGVDTADSSDSDSDSNYVPESDNSTNSSYDSDDNNDSNMPPELNIKEYDISDDEDGGSDYDSDGDLYPMLSQRDEDSDSESDDEEDLYYDRIENNALEGLTSGDTQQSPLDVTQNIPKNSGTQHENNLEVNEENQAQAPTQAATDEFVLNNQLNDGEVVQDQAVDQPLEDTDPTIQETTLTEDDQTVQQLGRQEHRRENLPTVMRSSRKRVPNRRYQHLHAFVQKCTTIM